MWVLHTLLGEKSVCKESLTAGTRNQMAWLLQMEAPMVGNAAALTGGGVSALGAGAGVPVRGCECSEVSAEAGRPLLLQPGGFCFENENPGARGTLKASRFRSHFRLSPHPRSRFMGCFLFVFKLYNNIFFSVRARSHLRAFHMSRPCLDRPPTHPHHFTSP